MKAVLGRLTPYFGVLGILITQLSTFFLFFAFDKELAGTVGICFMWANFLSQICLVGGDQGLVRVGINDKEKINKTHTFFLGLSTLFLLILTPVYIKLNTPLQLESFDVFLYSLLFFFSLKWLEIYAKIYAFYTFYTFFVLTSAAILLFSYYYSYFFNIELYTIITKVRVVGFLLLIAILARVYFVNRELFPQCFSYCDVKVIIKDNYKFLIILLLSTISIFIDKLIASMYLAAGKYADYMLLMAIYALAMQSKIIITNQYITDVNSENYRELVIGKSIKIVFSLFCLSFPSYYVMTEFIIDGYDYRWVCLLFLSISGVLETYMGPVTTILSMRYDPMKNIICEIVGIIMFLGLIILFSWSAFDVVFKIVICFSVSRLVISYLKLLFIKGELKCSQV